MINTRLWRGRGRLDVIRRSRGQPGARVETRDFPAKSLRELPDSLYSGIKLYANESHVTMDCCNFGGPGDQDDKDHIDRCALHALAACGFGLFPRLRPAKPSSAATHE